MALRTKTLDQRYLNKQDRSDWQQSGGAGRQKQALARTRAWKGQMNWEKNRPKKTTKPKWQQKSEGGDFTVGIGAQQQRLREKGEKLKRSRELRPEKYSMPDIYND